MCGSKLLKSISLLKKQNQKKHIIAGQFLKPSASAGFPPRMGSSSPQTHTQQRARGVTPPHREHIAQGHVDRESRKTAGILSLHACPHPTHTDDKRGKTDKITQVFSSFQEAVHLQRNPSQLVTLLVTSLRRRWLVTSFHQEGPFRKPQKGTGVAPTGLAANSH